MQDRFGQLQKCFEQKKEYFMINRTKIFTIALTGALAAVALTGCGGSASSSAAPSSVSGWAKGMRHAMRNMGMVAMRAQRKKRW